MDARLPFVAAYALEDTPGISSQLAPYRLTATAFTAFGVLALLVAAIGLYAVVAYAVARRTNEIGVRMALGATARGIQRLVLGEGLRHAALGVALGAALGMVVTRALRARLYGVAPWDAPTFVTTAVLLLATALLATWLPARRAARIAPTEALRSE
jgi:ABC-type antimicrobial peptide transport system permease subunit